MSDVLRRDPRAEWIARNRLHPLHAALQPRLERWMGPNGVLRKNVHGGGFIGPQGLKRIDRSGGQQGGSIRRAVSTSGTPRRAYSRAISAPMPLEAPVTRAWPAEACEAGAA